MEEHTRVELIRLAARSRAAERDLKIACVDAVLADRVSRSQVLRHAGVWRSTLDGWLRKPETIADAKISRIIDDCGVTALPDNHDRNAGRVPEDGPRGEPVFTLLRNGTRDKPGAAVHPHPRVFVGEYTPHDAAAIAAALRDRLHGSILEEPGESWTVCLWVDDIPDLRLDDTRMLGGFQ